MRVLGIDPGTATVGYGVVERVGTGAPTLVECGVLRTSPKAALPHRLQVIHAGLAELVLRHRPDVLAVEAIFYATNVRTTVSLGHARGVILLVGANAGVTIAEYPPATVKKTIVGRGAALKVQVGFMVAKLLKLAHPPEPADAADGVAIALTHLFLSGPVRQRS